MRAGRASVVAMALAGCVATGGAGEAEPAAAKVASDEAGPAGGLVVVGDGGAIPAEVRLAVLWGNDDAEPAIVVSPLATKVDPDGSLRVAGLPSPPQAMIMQAGDVGVALGYIVAYVDSDGDGTLTTAQDKPWRWPEFRGGIDRHALVYATGPIREGTRSYGLIGAHPGGLELARVELTAQCEGDSCRGHDKMSLGARPDRVVLVLPAEPASYRFPNLD